MLDCVVARDFDGATAWYAPEARYHVRSWQEPVIGRDAIRAEFTRQAGEFDAYSYVVVSALNHGSTVFMERIDTIEVAGRSVTIHWAAVHEVDADGLITLTRDYYDAAEMQAQLG
jgi:limonene-1,2-epoxide hydrolase